MNLVLDANILIRAILGTRVPALLQQYAERVDFCAPSIAFAEVASNLPAILESRRVPVTGPLPTIASVELLVRPIDSDTYRQWEAVARRRMAYRDLDDWPMLALALALDAPIWTEDLDFFGCGVATWTTDRIEELLAAVPTRDPQSAL